jgi:tetratricopeptide (TPR) repeat protein
LLVALGRSHGYLGDIYYYNARKRDDLDDAKQHYEKSESFRDKLVKLTPPDDPMYLEYLFQQARGKLNLAALARVTGDTEAALSKCNTGVDIQRQVCEAMESRPGQDRSHQAKYLSDLGYGRMLRSTLLREQRLAQAGVKTTSDAQELSDLTVASKALERAVRLIPGCAEYVINRTRSLVALGNARLELGDPQGAQNAYDEVMEVFNRHLMNEGESIANANPLATDDHDARNALAKAYLLRARLYRQVGDQNEALKFLGKAEPIAKSLFEESREHEIKSDYCEILAERGDLLAQLGRVDEGCELIKQAYTIQSDLCEVVSGMSLYRVRLGRFSEAMTRWENQRVATAAPKGQ